MNRQDKTALIKQEKIVVIIRAKVQSTVQPVIEALVKAGVKVLEITSNTVGFAEEIAKARASFPDILVGAGTVTNTDIAKKAIDAGAQFLVTPNTSKSVVEFAHKHDAPVLMGAYTATEVYNAYEYGADIVKLFPGHTGENSITYFKGIKGPLDTIPLMAVGGINLSNIKDWFEAGIDGVGVGGSLVKLDENNTLEIIEKTAKDMLAIAKEY